ncbi:MAG: DUF4912 domain-containing protein [Methylococcaceae bacterium]|nr:DUF4912 domain-containing protein [Methylococcaceae bacterium]
MTISPSIRYSAALLSSEEIFEISKEISTKYSPVIPVKKRGSAKKIALTPKQILDISEEITRRYTPKLNGEDPKLVMLPIDPDHLYVSWNLGKIIASPEIGDNRQNQNIVLRIYPIMEVNADADSTMDCFDVSIKLNQSRQTIALSSANKTNTYSAVLGKLDRNNALTVLASSQLIHKPEDLNSKNSPNQNTKLTSSQIQISSIQKSLLLEPKTASNSSMK